MARFKWVLIFLLLALPTCSLMFRSGIYTMQDFPHFRLFEFDKCVQERQFPCRWAQDAEMGYGEPLFNYYPQTGFWLGEMFHLLGLSILDSTKAAFAFSLLASGVTMYLFGKYHWGSWGGLVSALLYTYAPYRSTDVWVRAALPESLAFVFFPLILLALDKFLETRNSKYLIAFSLCLAGLITTHNLSVIMFLPFLAIYWVFQRKFWSFFKLTLAGIVSVILSSYYVFPVIFESHLVDLARTTQGYYDYHIHFATLKELFISRYWGYGASLWAKKFLSISLGQIQWVVALLAVIVTRNKKAVGFVLLGLLALFMAHGKSAFIWNLLPFLKFIQFPWRYVGVGIFFISMAGGALASKLANRYLISGLLLLIIITNFSFFRPDIWLNLSDNQFFSGRLWDESRTAHKDYWPKIAGNLPTQFAPALSPFVLVANRGNSINSFTVSAPNESTWVQLPVVYFPGWTAQLDSKPTPITPSASGLVSLKVPSGVHIVKLSFKDTDIRHIGNLLSLFGLFIVLIWTAFALF